MTHHPDRISRAELAALIRAAGEAEAARESEATLDLAEAERIAAEVGVAPEDFLAAVRAIRQARSCAEQPRDGGTRASRSR